MRVVTDKTFVPNKIKQSRWMTILGFLMLVGGWIVSFNVDFVIYSLFMLLIGFPLFNTGRYLAIRWGAKPREDEVLVEQLKTLDQRYTLYNYIQGMPVDHVLVTPAGLFVIETRHQAGSFTVIGDPARKRDIWKRNVKNVMARFFTWARSWSEGSLGNPSTDLQYSINQMRQHLAKNLPADILQGTARADETEDENEAEAAAETEPVEAPAPLKSTRGGFDLLGLGRRRSAPATNVKSPLPVDGVLVFTSPHAKVEINNPIMPVLQPADLKSYFRKPEMRDGSQMRLSILTLRRLSRLWETPNTEAYTPGATRATRPTLPRRPAPRTKDTRQVENKK